MFKVSVVARGLLWVVFHVGDVQGSSLSQQPLGVVKAEGQPPVLLHVSCIPHLGMEQLLF